VNDFNQKVIEEFRANQGKVGGMFEGADLALLTTTGAKSGRQTTSPVMYFPAGEGTVAVIASNGGADKHPSWYYNLRANPDVTVEIGTDKFEATATQVTDGDERDRLYRDAVAIAPGFAEYEAKTDRRIQVFTLARR
jgi:deazaflavin-dependent oxidoreductase (nitroreductase family)